MKKNSRTTIIIISIIIVLILWGISSYNKMVSMKIEVERNWAQVENQLQRRYDLIPNIVETVKGYANFEKDTLIAVTKARASVGSAKTVDEKIKANQQLDSAISRLLVVVEKYPDLKANENFKALIVELEGTENRIAVERKRYNDAVASFNTYIQKFPNNIFAGIFGFKQKEYYEISEEAKKAPKVKF